MSNPFRLIKKLHQKIGAQVLKSRPQERFTMTAFQLESPDRNIVIGYGVLSIKPFSRVSVQSKCISTVPKRDSSRFPEFEMPTVTWGSTKEREKIRQFESAVKDYLKNLGIVSDELADLELPSRIETMEERVDFLQGIGLTIDDINAYPRMLGCSVRKNLIPVIGFLEHVGVKKEHFAPIIRKFPHILFASVSVELVPVIKFLLGLDIEKHDIPYMLKRYPDVLGFKLEGTMSTSVAYLVSIGVNPKEIAPILSEYPWILGKRVATMIKPIVDYFIELGLPKQIVAKMIEKRPYILGYDLQEKMKPNVECLLDYGVTEEGLVLIIAQYPDILGLSLRHRLSSKISYFNSEMGLSAENFARLLERMPQIICLRQSVILKRLDFLRGRGFERQDITKMVIACPQLLAADIEDMKHSFYYFKSRMKKPLEELVDFPDYFTYNLELRIKPRFERLSKKGIRCSLRCSLNCSDRRFREILDSDGLDINSSTPCFRMGGAIKLPESKTDSEGENQEIEPLLYKSTVTIRKR